MIVSKSWLVEKFALSKTSEGDKNLKNLILKTELLNHLDTELIGNGGNSRLDIMLDLETGELWADEFYSHEEGSYQDYHDENIICVGKATNGIVLDDNDNDITLSGDYYNDNYNVDNVLSAIKDLYAEKEEMEITQENIAKVEKVEVIAKDGSGLPLQHKAVKITLKDGTEHLRYSAKTSANGLMDYFVKADAFGLTDGVIDFNKKADNVAGVWVSNMVIKKASNYTIY